MTASPVMVVGGAGFLGGHVCRWFAERDFEVVSFDLKKPLEPLHPSVRHAQGDILQPEALEDCISRYKVGGLVHLVAAGNEAAARENPAPAITLNVQGTLNVLEACRRQGVKKCVYVSTAGVYGRREDQKPIQETEPITWRGTVYHPSHYMGEVLVEMYGAIYGIEFAVLRPLAFYGPSLTMERLEHLRTKSLFFGAWILAALRGEEMEIKKADTLCDITYVKDAALAIYLAYTAPTLNHRLFNISSGILVSYRRIAEAIKQVLSAASFNFAPGVEDNPLRPVRGPLDIGRAGEDLRFAPQYNLENGMREYIEWLKA